MQGDACSMCAPCGAANAAQAAFITRSSSRRHRQGRVCWLYTTPGGRGGRAGTRMGCQQRPEQCTLCARPASRRVPSGGRRPRTGGRRTAARSSRPGSGISPRCRWAGCAAHRALPRRPQPASQLTACSRQHAVVCGRRDTGCCTIAGMTVLCSRGNHSCVKRWSIGGVCLSDQQGMNKWACSCYEIQAQTLTVRQFVQLVHG